MVQDQRPAPAAPAPPLPPASASGTDPQNLAIGALVCAVMGIFCFVTAIPAIVLGHMTRAQAKRTAERRGMALATVALVIAYGFLAAITIMMGFSFAHLSTAWKRVRVEDRIYAEKEEQERARAEAEEARRNTPMPVERGPLPVRLSAGLPFNLEAIAKEPNRYRPLSYARAQVCRGEGDAREQFVAAVEGSLSVKDDGLRYRYGTWIAGCGEREPCQWLRKRAQVTQGALRAELQEQLEGCAEPAKTTDDEPEFSWTIGDPFGNPKPAAEQLTACAADKGKPPGERYRCLEQLARSDRASASALAAGLLADGTVAKLDLRTEQKDLAAAMLYSQLKSLAEYPTLEALELRLQSLGLLPVRPRPTSKLPPVTVEELLEAYGRRETFDVETGEFPNHHDLLAAQLWRLADQERVYFEEIPPLDRDGEDEGDYRLHAFTAQHQYSVIARNHGDWYDLDAVLRLLDRMLTDANSELRSAALPTGDQYATVILAPPAAVAAARQLGLLLTESTTAAETDGKAFEAEVLKRIAEQAP
jgi:hypothetical protein